VDLLIALAVQTASLKERKKARPENSQAVHHVSLFSRLGQPMNDCRHPQPVLRLVIQLPATGGGQRIVFCFPAILGNSPLGTYPCFPGFLNSENIECGERGVPFLKYDSGAGDIACRCLS
jgi:hypothetical protein